MSGKSIVYTSIFGAYDKLIDPIANMNGVKCICFTDNEDMHSDIWDIRVIKPYIPTDSCRSARYVKINAHEFLPEFDYSMYIDGNMLLKIMPNIPWLLGNYKFAMGLHSGRDCIYEEARICRMLGKDKSHVINAQVTAYKEINFPEHAGLYASGAHFKMHNDATVIEHCMTWWEHIVRYSMRDQISFPVAFSDYPVKSIPHTIIDKYITVCSLHPCEWQHHV